MFARNRLLRTAVLSSIVGLHSALGIAQGDSPISEIFSLPEDATLFSDVSMTADGQTNLNWVKTYLNLEIPGSYTKLRLEEMRKKLMTTEIFLSVDIVDRTTTASDGSVIHTLHFDLKEKLTIIPVVRGAFGGGTPLFVAGLYNIHTWGSLWTLGLDLRKYGDSPLGWILWARAPRWRRGKHFLNFELWDLTRDRTIYNAQFEPQAAIQQRVQKFRGTFLHPLSDPRDYQSERYVWQLGLDLQCILDSRTTGIDRLPSELSSRIVPTKQEFWLMPMLVRDTISMEIFIIEGYRLMLSGGALISDEGEVFGKGEAEIFAYATMSGNWVLAGHAFAAYAGTNTLTSQNFLGGLESIRGIPDGALWGANAWYINSESRFLVNRMKYVETEVAVFMDAGNAGKTLNDAFGSSVTTAGIGMRFNIPQIFRFMIRADYAWLLSDPSIQSVNVGLNHLFQPNRPL